MTHTQRRTVDPIRETPRAAATQPDLTADDVLAMPSADLLQWLRREAAANPAVEIVKRSWTTARRETCPPRVVRTRLGLSVATAAPDVIIARESGTAAQRGFVIDIAESLRCSVRVRPGWIERHIAASDPLAALAEDERRFVREQVARAREVIALVQQRRHTLVRLAQCLIDLHWDALQRGEDALPPLARAPVAFRAGMHEATLIRAIAGKLLQLPNGILVPLHYCFQTEQGITTAILELVAHEVRPLTDADLVRALGRRAIHLDERSVAAYRRQLGVPPARLRGPAPADAPPHPAPPRARPARAPVMPSARARQLLRAVLTRQEREQLAHAGYLDVPSPGHPHRLYRIPNYLGRVRMFEQGQAVCDLCVVSSESLPADDVIVMHKLMIQGDEEAYLRSANRFPVYSFAAADPTAQIARP
jgi:hypothetical protein